jgi:hypothetical protein
MSNNDIFEKFDTESRGVIDRIKRFGIEYFPYIMLVLNLVFEVLSRLYKIGFAEPFTPDFWASLFINTASSTMAYACFVFYAERKKKENSVYIANAQSWGEISQKVRLNYFDEFLEYCKAQYERECRERRVALIVNHTQITLERWENHYKALTPREIAKKVREGEITAHDAKYIKRANAPLHIKPIKPLLILAGMKVNDLNDAGRSSTSTILSIVTRPIPVIVMSICFSMFAGTFVGVSDSSAVFDMIYTAIMIVGSSLIGYTKGVNNAEKKAEEIKARIIFLERFLKTI